MSLISLMAIDRGEDQKCLFFLRIYTMLTTMLPNPNHRSAEEFMENLGNAAKSLQETLPKVIEFVAGKNTTEL